MVFVSELGLTRFRTRAQTRPQSASAPAQETSVSQAQAAEQEAETPTETRSRSGSVPIYGAEVEQDRTTAVTVRKTSRSVAPAEALSATGPVSVVQCQTAWQSVADRLAAVRGTVMVAVDHDSRVADLILDSLLLHGQAKRSAEQLRELVDKSERQMATVSGAYVNQTIQRAEGALEKLEQYIQNVVSDPVALRKLIEKLRHTTTETRRALSSITQARELAERRAYLRAAVRRVQLRLQQLPELSVQDRAVREQLQPFAALDSFANIPETATEQQALSKTLEELEPVFDRLQESINAIMERPLPTVDPSMDETLQADEDWWSAADAVAVQPAAVDEAPAAVDGPALQEEVKETQRDEMSSPFEAEASATASASVSPVEPVPVASDTPPSPVADVATPPAQETATEPTGLSQGLGMYRLQRGDSLADLLLGETDAGILPAMVEVPPSYIGTLAELLRDYLDQYRTVRQYLGTRESIDVWAMRGNGHPEISLDHLNDIVMYIAVRNELLDIANDAWERLAAAMGELEAEANALEETLAEHASAFTPHSVRQRAQGKSRGVRWANFGRSRSAAATPSASMSTRQLLPADGQTAWQQVIDQIYQGDTEAYETDLANWIETLFLASQDRTQLVGSVLGRSTAASDPRQAFLALRFSDWYSLLHDTALRFEWLQRHAVPASVWRDWSRQVLTWQRIVQKHPRNEVYQLPLLAIAELVFLDRSLRPRAR